MSPRYSVFHRVVLSFYSRALYRDVGLEGRGVGFLYLFLLLAVLWLVPMVGAHRGIAKWVDEEAAAVLEQVPPITVTDGVVSTPEDRPYVITDPATGETLAIIDTTGATTSLDGTDTKFLVTRTSLMVRKSAAETRTFDLSQVKEFAIDRDRLEGWLSVLRTWLIIGIYPFVLAFSFAYRVVQALVYGAIGLALANALRVGLGYAATIRLAVLAVTPVLLLDAVMGLADARFFGWSLVCLGIAMGYLFFGVKACATAPATA